MLSQMFHNVKNVKIADVYKQGPNTYVLDISFEAEGSDVHITLFSETKKGFNLSV